MQTKNAESCSRALQVLVPVTALLLLAVLAVPADAQRGGRHGGGSGHHGQYGSGHQGGGHGYGSRGYGGRHGSYGYGHQGRGRGGHSGYGHQGRGHGGYYAYGRHGGSHGGHYYGRADGGYHRNGHYSDYGRGRSYGYGYGYGHYGSGGHYGYPSHYRGDYRSRGSYVYYRSPGYWGFDYRGYPISVRYDAAPSYVVAGKSYSAPSYQASIAPPERVVTENGEPYPAAEPADVAEPRGDRQHARVNLRIEPADATVYLDGRFLGLASELPEELWLDPGSHRLEIARPGFAGRALDLELGAGEELDVDARLQP